MNDNQQSGGYVLQAALRVVLLLAIVGQVVFLATRYRARADVTADRMFTLTDSTRRVLSGLDDRLLIEAYFSADDKLSPVFRERRRALNNFLDELVQLSDGKVVIRRFDPQDDQMVRERAERLGIQAVTIGDQGDAAFAIKEIWQGLRLMYGADRQDTVQFVDFYFASPAPTAMWESLLTPKVKALTVAEKPKIGLLAYATEAGPGAQPFGQGGGQSKGFTELAKLVEGHYELQNIDLNEGQLVPDEIHDLIVVRPKKLTDRQKYAIDQFLMRGGSLVVFADTSEVEIGERRVFRGRKVSYDAADAKLKFVDQLAHYGADVDEKVVAEGLGEARRTEAFRIPIQTVYGVLPSQPLNYPYWFHAVAVDWAQYAKEIAQMTGASDGDLQDLIAKYRESFESGVDTDNYMLKAMGRGPGMFWACPVELAETLPEGVSGEVLMRTSPVSYVEEPPPDFNPVGFSMNPRDAARSIDSFEAKVGARLRSEPRQQFGLMVSLNGSFKSFFEGKEIPPRPEPEQSAMAGPQPGQLGPQPPPVDPLALPVTQQPIEKGTPPQAQTPAQETGTAAQKGGPPKAEGEQPKGSAPEGVAPGSSEPPPEAAEAPKTPKKGEQSGGDGADGGAAAGAPQEPQNPEKPAAPAPKAQGEGEVEPPAGEAEVPAGEPAEAALQKSEQEPQAPAEATQGEGPPEPVAPQGEEPAKDEDPAPVLTAPSTARLIVIGDSDFVRDDLVRGEYGQLGPYSPHGPQFFVNLVDWLAEDQDLLALRNKTAPDRRLVLVDETMLNMDREAYAAEVKELETALTFLNVAGPFAAILLIWLAVSLLRRSRKQSFLSTVQA